MVSVKRNAGDEGHAATRRSTATPQVEGFTPDAQKVASDTALVNQQAQKVGKNFIDSQKDLPDVIVVGGSGGGASNPPARGTVTEMAETSEARRSPARAEDQGAEGPGAEAWGARPGTGLRRRSQEVGRRGRAGEPRADRGA